MRGLIEKRTGAGPSGMMVSESRDRLKPDGSHHEVQPKDWDWHVVLIRNSSRSPPKKFFATTQGAWRAHVEYLQKNLAFYMRRCSPAAKAPDCKSGTPRNIGGSSPPRRTSNPHGWPLSNDCIDYDL